MVNFHRTQQGKHFKIPTSPTNAFMALRTERIKKTLTKNEFNTTAAQRDLMKLMAP